MVGTIAFGENDLKAYAAKAGLGLQFIVKEAFLFELMELLGEHEFVLKGGTAINKGYLEGHQRFSEDLDYDTELGKEGVRKALAGLGWKIGKEFFTRNSLGFLFEYSFGGVKDAVKAEFSFGINGAAERRKAVSDFLPVSKRVEMYVFPELNRQKELAFGQRKEWKDLYDLYWMQELYPKEFKIRGRKAFQEAISSMSIQKTANAYIPRAKRLNWEEVREYMSSKWPNK